ncbi:MAG: F0F1 ATP synthase subunit A [Lachnobacterium sp.]|jgi:F-type H+-transporting ATPase subunit a|nr:F0F1 ATP synthase subunit A [Lachnobacterium sp.]
MDALVKDLLEQLECRNVFEIPIFGGISISESVVVTWIIMAVLFVLCFFLGRNLSVENPSRKQLVIEMIVKGLYDTVAESVGKNGVRYIFYLMTVMIYIGFANIIGVIGFKPPTKDMSVTVALALMSIILIHLSGIIQKGVGGWLKGFMQPVPVLLPLNILEIFIKPLSLCMRLFGNVLGAFIIMELLKIVAPVVVPGLFSLYFDLFDGGIQAYVFVFLTSLFIAEETETEE